jgi:hypothetical protein
MRINEEDNPVIVYTRQYPYYDLRLAEFDGESWDMSTIYDDMQIGRYTGFVLNGSGPPSVLFPATDIPNGRPPKLASLNDGAWGIEELEGNASFGLPCDLEFASLPGLAGTYYSENLDEDSTRFLYFQEHGTNWAYTTLGAGSHIDYTVSSPSLDFDSGGRPAIAYMDVHTNKLMLAWYH